MSEQYYDLIDRIIRQEASNLEKERFEELLKTDSVFKNEYELRFAVKTVFKEEENEKMRSEIKAWELDLDRKRNKMYWYRIAAGILVFACAMGSLLFSGRSSSGETLFETYYVAFPNVITSELRGEQSAVEGLAGLMSDYDKRDYQIFLKKLESVQDERLELYAAIAHIELNQIGKAKEILSRIKSKSSENLEESIWYLALIALKENDQDQARALLMSIAGLSSPLGKRATQLLKEF